MVAMSTQKRRDGIPESFPQTARLMTLESDAMKVEAGRGR